MIGLLLSLHIAATPVTTSIEWVIVEGKCGIGGRPIVRPRVSAIGYYPAMLAKFKAMPKPAKGLCRELIPVSQE